MNSTQGRGGDHCREVGSDHIDFKESLPFGILGISEHVFIQKFRKSKVPEFAN